MSKENEMKWKNVTLSLGGEEIGVIPISYESEEPKKHFRSSFVGTISLKSEEIEQIKAFAQSHKTKDIEEINSKDFVKFLKEIGVTLLFGVSNFPLGYSYEEVIEVDNKELFENYLKTISRKEWKGES